MIVERTFDREMIKSIINNPNVWDRIRHDDMTAEECEPNVDSHCWLSFDHNGIIVGVYRLQPISSVTLDCHIDILPEYRYLAHETALAFYRWFLDNCGYHKLQVTIPVIYPMVRNFVRKFGFEDEGLLRESIKKDGVLIDQWVLGITRKEVEAYGRRH